MVEIKITEQEERNEYLLTPSQTFLGARYDNLSDEIKIIFPQREIDNESICTMIITSSSKEVDCVTVRHNEIFKLHSPMSHYRQVAIGFSFQKDDGYIKNSNIGLFYFREAQNPDENVPVEPIQREKINLMLATGFAGVEWAEDNSNILQFKNVDGEVVKRITIKIPTDTKDLTNGANFITVEEVDEKIERVESIAKGSNQAITYGDYQTMITAFNNLPKDTYNVGQNVMIITLGVPDLWVAFVEETSVPYTYTNDEVFTNELEAQGFIQVGHYKLGALETQKVNLVEYAKKTEVPNFTATQLDDGSYSLSITTPTGV